MRRIEIDRDYFDPAAALEKLGYTGWTVGGDWGAWYLLWPDGADDPPTVEEMMDAYADVVATRTADWDKVSDTDVTEAIKSKANGDAEGDIDVIAQGIRDKRVATN